MLCVMQGTREGVGEMSLEMHVGAGHPGTWQPWQGVEVSLWHRVCHFGQVFSDSWDDPEIDTHAHTNLAVMITALSLLI